MGRGCATAVERVLCPSDSLWALAGALGVAASSVPPLEARLAARRAAAAAAAVAAAASAPAPGQDWAGAEPGQAQGSAAARDQPGVSNAAEHAPVRSTHAAVQGGVRSSACAVGGAGACPAAVRSERQALAAQRVAALQEELQAAEGVVAELRGWLAQAQGDLDSAMLEGAA